MTLSVLEVLLAWLCVLFLDFSFSSSVFWEMRGTDKDVGSFLFSIATQDIAYKALCPSVPLTVGSGSFLDPLPAMDLFLWLCWFLFPFSPSPLYGLREWTLFFFGDLLFFLPLSLL